MFFLMFFMIKTVWVVCLKLSSFTVQREILFRCACVGVFFFKEEEFVLISSAECKTLEFAVLAI